MKRDLYYKPLGFMTIDYKAYEDYLQDLALKGYELVGVGPVMVGRFKKIEPRPIRYYVDLISDADAENYIELCEESGWELVDKIGHIKLFKEKEGCNPLPIHTDSEIEASNIIQALLRNEGWMIFLLPIWVWISFQNVQNIDYTDLLSNVLLMNPLMQILLAFFYVFHVGWMGYYVWQLKKGRVDSRLWKPSVKAAKRRRNIGYGIAGTCIAILLTSFLDSGIGILIMLLFMGILTLIVGITSRYYKNSDKGIKAKCLLIASIIIPFFLMTFGGMQVSLIMHVWDREDVERVESKVDKVGPLSIKDFPGYEEETIERRWIDTGKSIAVKKYYEYQEYLVGDGDLEVNYYEFRNEKLTDFYLEGLLEKSRKYSYRDEGLNPVDVHLFNVEEVYSNKEWERLLLRDENKILLLESRTLQFFDPPNIEIIEAVIK